MYIISIFLKNSLDTTNNKPKLFLLQEKTNRKKTVLHRKNERKQVSMFIHFLRFYFYVNMRKREGGFNCIH